MKIIATYNTATSQEQSGRKILVWPDSAMINSGKLLFLPEEPDCFIVAGLGARIKSVGKTIKTRFAPRYYDEIAPLFFILKKNVVNALKEGQDPYACDIVSDFSVIWGEKLNKETVKDSCCFVLEYSDLDRESMEFSEEWLPHEAIEELNESIASASISNTIKTGDIVGFLGKTLIPASHDHLIKVKTDNGKTILETKLK